MKKFFLFSLFIISLNSKLFAYCYYVDCHTSVTSATSITALNLTSIFSQIEKNISDLDQKYNEYYQVLKENNDLYDKNILLKSQYLSILQEITYNQEKLKKINSTTNKKDIK